MSYQVLARKWRPQTFSELVGQQHVVDAITNALQNDKLHHAYLFTGTRGVGKTTIARIFSKSLNCEQGQSANPCGKCDTCVDISDGRYVDLLEIDAASRTKVEDTRELLDNVQYRPTRGKYKVYLIDEVHMLSKHSFNALLKTLEEPPEHVKFLLATTDPQKLPVTILSRCLQFSLKALTRDQIHAHLSHVLGHESIPFEDAALVQLARAAQGSIRDSLSLTDQAIAQGNNRVSLATVTNMLGLLDKNQILKLVKCICERDSEGALEQLEHICAQSPEYGQVLSQTLGLLHQIALTQIVPEVCKLEGSSAKGIYTLAKALGKEHIQLLYQIALNGKRDLPHAPDGKTGLQMTVLRMLAFTPVQKIELDVDALISDEHANLPAPTLSPSASLAPSASTMQTESINNEQTVAQEQHAPVTSEQYTADNLQASASEQAEPTTPVNDMFSGEKSSLEDTPASADMFSEDETAPSTNGNSSVSSAMSPDMDAEQLLNANSQNVAPNDNDPVGFINSDESEDAFHQAMSEASYQQDDEHHLDAHSASSSLTNTPLSDAPQTASQSTQSAQLNNTLELIKVVNELAEQNPEGANNGKKSDADEPITNSTVVDHGYVLGQKFPVFDKPLTPFIVSTDDTEQKPQKLYTSAQIDAWSAFVDASGLKAFTRQLLINANCFELSNPMVLKISEEQQHLTDEELLSSVSKGLNDLLNEDFEIKIEVGEVINTPFQIQSRIDEMRLEYARNLVNTDDSIQELIKAFDAKVIEQSIEAR